MPSNRLLNYFAFKSLLFVQSCVFLRSHAAHWRAAPALHGTSRPRRTAATVITAMASGSDQTKNVLGGELQCCCTDPVTGFQRDGYCKVVPGDGGVHAVCAQVSSGAISPNCSCELQVLIYVYFHTLGCRSCARVGATQRGGRINTTRSF